MTKKDCAKQSNPGTSFVVQVPEVGVSVGGKTLLLFVSNIHLHFEVLNVIRLS